MVTSGGVREQGLSVKATKGDALLFYSLKPNGEPDEASMHGSCPTTKVPACLRLTHHPETVYVESTITPEMRGKQR